MNDNPLLLNGRVIKRNVRTVVNPRQIFIVVGNVGIRQQILQMHRLPIRQRMPLVHLRHHRTAMNHLAIQSKLLALLTYLLRLIAGIMEDSHAKGSAAYQLENILRGLLLDDHVHQILVGKILLIVQCQNPYHRIAPLGRHQQRGLLLMTAVKILTFQYGDIHQNLICPADKLLSVMSHLNALIRTKEK